MIATQNTARESLRHALDARTRAGIGREDPICVFDLADRLSLNVWFKAASSFEGIYDKASQSIVIPSQRPRGRQAFSCAHEVGHWAFGHGTRIDLFANEHSDFSKTSEESAADIFAGYLLMTPWAVKSALARRKLNPNKLSPLDAYALSTQFGVSYEGLVQHISRSLKLLSYSKMDILLRTTPKEIRDQLVGPGIHRHIAIVDRAWRAVPIDLSIGDMAIVPKQLEIHAGNIVVVGDHPLGQIIRATQPGIGRIEMKDRTFSSFIRVSRQEFEGRNIYRHMEDPDVN